MVINSIKKLKTLANKTVLLRVDFDVPLKNGKIYEDERIEASLETINFLLKKKCRLVIIAHLGRPNGKKNVKYSLKPIALHLKKLLKKPVKFIPEVIGTKVETAVKKMKAGEVILLENLRFEQGELDNDVKFAKQLASLADIYVNDAFATSHRDQVSFSAIKKFLPAYAGLLLEKEIKALAKISKPKKPVVVVMGGAKLKTKLPLIAKLYPKANQILLSGGLANTFFKYQKQEIGQSLYDPDSLDHLKEFYQGKSIKPKIILPIDVVVSNKKGWAVVKKPEMVEKDENILDIGPATINKYSTYIKKAQTLICNGPMGKFEDPSFKHGTLAIVSLVAARSTGKAYGVIGGGDIIKALEMTKMADHVDWVSMAGGAMLTYLGGGKMPGLNKIIKK